MISNLRRAGRRLSRVMTTAMVVCTSVATAAVHQPSLAAAATGDIRPLDELYSTAGAGEILISEDGSTILRSVLRQEPTSLYTDLYRVDSVTGSASLIVPDAEALWVSPDGGETIVRRLFAGRFQRVDTATGAVIEELPTLSNWWGNFDISGDGTQLSYISYANDANRYQLFVMDLTTGVSSQLTTDAGQVIDARLSHDGSQVFFTVNGMPSIGLTSQRWKPVMLDRTTATFTVLSTFDDRGWSSVNDITRDSRYVILGDGDGRSWRVDTVTGEALLVSIANNGALLSGRVRDISDDGRFIAMYASGYGEPERIVVRDLGMPTPMTYELPLGSVVSADIRFSPDASHAYVFASPSLLGFGHPEVPYHWFALEFNGPGRGIDAVEVAPVVSPSYGPYGIAWRKTPSVVQWRAQLLDASPVTTPAPITIDQPGMHTVTSEQSCPISGTAACGVGTATIGYDPDVPVVNTVAPFTNPYPENGDNRPWEAQLSYLEVVDALSGIGSVQNATIDDEVCANGYSGTAASCYQWGSYGNGPSALFTTEAPLADGVHTFTANATDRVGNTVAISTTFRVGPPPAEIDLALAYTSDLPTMTSADLMHWTARVHNQTNEYAGPFTVTMQIPVGMEVVPTSVAPHGSIDADVVTFTIDDLAPANSIDLGMDTFITDVEQISFRSWAEVSTMSQSDLDSTPDAIDGNDAYIARDDLNDALTDIVGDEDDHDDATVEIRLTPSIAVDLAANTIEFDAPGQTADWQATVTNTGDAAVNSLSLLSSSGDAFDCDAAVLPIGASTSCWAMHQVTQLDLDQGGIFESVTATAVASNGVAVEAVSDLLFVGAVQTPAITVDAFATPAAVVRVGDVMTFTSTVTNTGNITVLAPLLTATAVTMTCPLAPDETLAPGSSVTCSGSRPAASGDFVTGVVTNEVHAIADGLNGVSAEATASAFVTAQQTAPSEPRNVTVTGGNRSLSVRWALSASDGGSTVLGHRIRATDTTTGVTVVVSASRFATSGSVTGLTNGRTYSVTVEAYNAVGATPSPAITARTWSILTIDTPLPVTEGNTGTRTVTFTVRLDALPSAPVTVRWATATNTVVPTNQRATSSGANPDFNAANGTLTFSTSQLSRTFTVTIRGDRTVEQNEVFDIALSSASGAAIGVARATATIQNDD